MSADVDRQSIEQAERLVEQAARAQKVLAGFSQEKVDKIVSVMAAVARDESYRLGEMAQLETGYGIAADKALKNRFSAKRLQFHTSSTYSRSHQRNRERYRSGVSERGHSRDYSLDQP